MIDLKYLKVDDEVRYIGKTDYGATENEIYRADKIVFDSDSPVRLYTKDGKFARWVSTDEIELAIEEKNIERLKERNEALEMGFELVLVLSEAPNHWAERIKFGKYKFITNRYSYSYLNGGVFGTTPIINVTTTPWFDIQAPKMRDMTPLEALKWCHDNNKIQGKKYADTGTIHYGDHINMDFDYNGFVWGFLNDNMEFEKCPQTEDKKK